jgi:hypothetical protein
MFQCQKATKVDWNALCHVSCSAVILIRGLSLRLLHSE